MYHPLQGRGGVFEEPTGEEEGHQPEGDTLGEREEGEGFEDLSRQVVVSECHMLPILPPT